MANCKELAKRCVSQAENLDIFADADKVVKLLSQKTAYEDARKAELEADKVEAEIKKLEAEAEAAKKKAKAEKYVLIATGAKVVAGIGLAVGAMCFEKSYQARGTAWNIANKFIN